MKKISLKKGLEKLGYTNITISRGYNYRSGFMEKDGQLYYFNTFDLRYFDTTKPGFVLTRTAKHRQDFTGGVNTYHVVNDLAKLGYVLSIPRCNCDYNGR